MPFDQNSGGTLTLDPDEVESAPEAKALDASEVEEAPSSSGSARSPLVAAAPGKLQPAGAAGPLPGIPQPRVDMRVSSIGQTLTGENPQTPLSPAGVYNYGQNAIPRAAQGVREVGQGHYVKGATDVLGGVNDAIGSQILPLGSAPGAVVKGLAGSMAGATAAPYVAKKLGASPDVQALAGEAGAALPMAAGVGADLFRKPGPEILPPVRENSVEVPEAGNLLTAGDSSTIDASEGTQPADITKHSAGKVTAIDEKSGLPIVDRTQPSEMPSTALAVRGENLPPQTGAAGPMSPEAEAISAGAASQASQPQEDVQDLQDRLASGGINGEEAKGVLEPYLAADDPRDVTTTPWEDQVKQAYSNLANLRNVAPNGDEDYFGDKDTARDAREAVEQVISHFHPDTDANSEPEPDAQEGLIRNSHARQTATEPERSESGPALAQRQEPVSDSEAPSKALGQDEVEDAPAALAKGSTVRMRDGSTGKVAYLDAAMKIARVAKDGGGTVTVRQSDISPIGGSTDQNTQQNLNDFVGKVATRHAMEAHGQDILDKMDERGESPRDVSNEFWDKTYFKLPAAAQQRFQKQLNSLTGMEPGDVIAVRPDKSGVVAKDWSDIARDMLPDRVEHLEGGERGYTALMREANERVASNPRGDNAAKPILVKAGTVTSTELTRNAALRPGGQLSGAQQVIRPVQQQSRQLGLEPATAPPGPRAVVSQVRPVEKAKGSMEDNSSSQDDQINSGKSEAQTMYSGGAVFDPEAWKTLFPDVAERFSDWVNDKQDEGDKQAAIMRETRGELDRRTSIAAKQLEKVQRDFRLRPRQDALDFFNAAEGVTPMNSIPAKDQALAATFKGYFDKMKADLQSLNPNVLQDFIENYFPHIWEQPSHAASVFKQVLSGKRPFAGSGAFLKQRTIPTIQDGLALGLKPVSYNPVDLFLAKYHEMSRFLMAHKTLAMMKDAGTAKLVRPGTAPPDGWAQLDDRIGTVMAKDADDNLFIRGHYYAPAPAAKVFNAYVSKGLAGRSAIFDTLQAANNRLNALQLGISAFHATTTAVNAAASDIALGAQQITQGKPLQGIKNLAEGATYLPSMISTFRNGSKLMKEYLSPGSYAKFGREANAVSLAGGRIRQNTLEIKPLTQALDDLKAGAMGSALKKTIPAIIDASSRPIMEQWVPRMKLGAFYGMANNILDTADREGWSHDEIRDRMQTAWNSIDNRFGQMVYDNLFWDKALRDVLMASTRSVGWNAGTIRELGGAASDTAQQAAKAVSGKAPELTDRMGFAIGMTVSAGLLGSAIYYLLNGERPQTWKDAYFPGKKGEARMSIPGYMKDVVAYAHDPKQTILNKMSPVLSMLSAALENRDFYGTEIRHPDDPVVQQLWQLAKFAGAEAMPFSFRGVQKLVEGKGSLETSVPGQVKEAFRSPKELVAGQFGFQPAPAYIQNSPALNKAHEYDMANMPPGTRTQEQARRDRWRKAIQIQYQSGHPDRAAIENLVKEGKLTQREVNSAITTSKTDPLIRAARSLHLEQVLNVYAKADQREQHLLRPIIQRKVGDIEKESDPQKRASLKVAVSNAMHGKPAGASSLGSNLVRRLAMP